MSVALGSCKSAVVVENSRKDAKRSKTVLAPLVNEKEFCYIQYNPRVEPEFVLIYAANEITNKSRSLWYYKKIDTAGVPGGLVGYPRAYYM